MAHHIGDGLAQGERDHGFPRGCEAGRLNQGFELDSGGFEGGAGVAQFAFDARQAVPADGGAHLAEGVAGDGLDVADLLLGALGIRGEQFGSQFRFEDDDREGVAQQVVQIARDTLALGDAGEVLDFLLRAQKLFDEALAVKLMDDQ